METIRRKEDGGAANASGESIVDNAERSSEVQLESGGASAVRPPLPAAQSGANGRAGGSGVTGAIGGVRGVLATAGGKKEFACDLCGKTYPRKDHVKRHQQRQHASGPFEKTFVCEHGDAAFATRAELNRHVRRVHTKCFKCCYCVCCYAREIQLWKHLCGPKHRALSRHLILKALNVDEHITETGSQQSGDGRYVGVGDRAVGSSGDGTGDGAGNGGGEGEGAEDDNGGFAEYEVDLICPFGSCELMVAFLSQKSWRNHLANVHHKLHSQVARKEDSSAPEAFSPVETESASKTKVRARRKSSAEPVVVDHERSRSGEVNGEGEELCEFVPVKQQCPDCGEAYISGQSLRQHIRREHLHGKRFSCDLCDYATADKSSLQRHLNTRKHKERAGEEVEGVKTTEVKASPTAATPITAIIETAHHSARNVKSEVGEDAQLPPELAAAAALPIQIALD